MTILDYLELDARKYPDKSAFIDPARKVTYQELASEADRVAKYILDLGFRGEPIAIYEEKSVTCVCLMLGVMKSGNFFTVIDADMPVERLKNTLSTFQPVCILSEEKYREGCEKISAGIDTLFYEDMKHGKAMGAEEYPPVSPDDTAVVLFTSGTTGTPKGVELQHGAIAAAAEIRMDTFGYDEDVCFADQFPVYTIAHITINVACTIRAGGTDRIFPGTYFKSPVKLINFLNQTDVNTLDWSAPSLRILSEISELSGSVFKNITTVRFGGEPIPVKTLDHLMRVIPNARFINVMTGTELLCVGTFYEVKRDRSYSRGIPLGIPMKNTSIILVDENENIVSETERGEMCVSTPAMAKGYYHDASETEKKFRRMRDKSGKMMRFYKTGDLACLNEDGELEYSGRKDFQIKKHGYRIELEDIEAAADTIPEINGCGCIYDAGKEKIILFYSGNIHEKDVRSILRDKLPLSMLPDAVISLPSIPRNATGKTDRIELKKIYLTMEGIANKP